MNVTIEESWKEVLSPEFEKAYFKELTRFVKDEYMSVTVYPRPKDIFSAFFSTPFSKVRVVILGQDPYHGPLQAHGLSFSVHKRISLPPSLQNIYKEIADDLGKPIDLTSVSGDLTHWAEQGVLLLNATLTVRARQAGSHQGKGWEQFTDTVIQKLSEEREGIVFLLWGRYAQEKGRQINKERHYVLEAPHPSPFSAHKGFFGCKHFSRTNTYLKEHGQKEIDWTPKLKSTVT